MSEEATTKPSLRHRAVVEFKEMLALLVGTRSFGKGSVQTVIRCAATVPFGSRQRVITRHPVAPFRGWVSHPTCWWRRPARRCHVLLLSTRPI